MGATTDIVAITLTTVAARTSEEGFGTPLIMSYNATFPERSREYSDPADMVADGMAITTPEYLAATALMSQELAPESFKIGRGALKPTQVWTITPVVADSTEYAGEIDGVAWTFTSDASATLAEICTGVAAAIDAAIGATFTVVSTGTTVTVTGAAAGNWCSVEVSNPALLALAQTHADPGIATDLAAIELFDSDWYVLHTSFNSSALVAAAAAWVEARTKIYLPRTADTAVANTTESGSDDIGEIIDAANYQRTFPMYHHVPSEFADAAWLGLKLPTEPGTENWQFATLTGVTATPLTTQQKANLDDKCVNGYYSVFGVDQTFKGISGAGAPYFIDYVRFRDMFSARLGEALFNLLSQAEKLPMTDAGMIAIKNELLEVCKRFENTGALAAGLSSVTVPRVADISASNRSNRIATDIVVDVTYTGAVNKVNLSVRVAI